MLVEVVVGPGDGLRSEAVLGDVAFAEIVTEV